MRGLEGMGNQVGKEMQGAGLLEPGMSLGGPTETSEAMAASRSWRRRTRGRRGAEVQTSSSNSSNSRADLGSRPPRPTSTAPASGEEQ